MNKFVIGNGSVEIVAINPFVRSIHMLITLPCKPAEMNTENAKIMLLHKANFAFWYLQQEGFLADKESGWLFHLAGVPKEKA